MLSLTTEQILVISVLSIWFLFPLGILVSFIRQSNEAHPPKIKNQPLANDLAHSPAYAPEINDDVLEDEEEFEPTPISAYQIPKNNQNSNDIRPGM